MPYIETKTNVKMTDAQKKELKAVFADAIELIPGKSEEWLMLRFEDGAKMAFRGNARADSAMVEVELLGSATADEYSALTAKITEILGEVLKISPDRVYVKYEEAEHWGWNGANF